MGWLGCADSTSVIAAAGALGSSPSTPPYRPPTRLGMTRHRRRRPEMGRPALRQAVEPEEREGPGDHRDDQGRAREVVGELCLRGLRLSLPGELTVDLLQLV